jgi:hypothetical protein
MFGGAQQDILATGFRSEAVGQGLNRVPTTLKHNTVLRPLKLLRGILLTRSVKIGEDRRPEAS